MLLSIPLLKYERMRRRVDSVPSGVHAEAPSVYLLDLLVETILLLSRALKITQRLIDHLV